MCTYDDEDIDGHDEDLCALVAASSVCATHLELV